jgi:cell division protein FtsW
MLRPGQIIALCALALLTIGVVMVTSALMDVARPVTPEGIVLSRWSAYMLLALAAMATTALVPWWRWVPGRWLGASPARAASTAGTEPDAEPRGSMTILGRTVPFEAFGGWLNFHLWLVALALVGVMALVYVPGVGREVNGAHRWINLVLPGLGDLSVQPSEIAKWALIPLMAWYAVVMRERLGRFFTGLAPALGAVAIVAGFIVIEDLGTAVLLGGVASIVLIAGGARIWQFVLMLPLAGLAFASAVLANPYRLTRIETFLNPYADPEGSGYHMIQSMLAVHNGEVWGRGLGHGLQKFGYLPEDHTDFLFAIICEEMGVPGAMVVICLYAGIVWAAWLIVRRQQVLFFKLVATGIFATLGLQAIINLAVVTGLGPTKGIALPLLSSGGTGWILTSACLGVLIGIERAALAHQSASQGDAIEPADRGRAPAPQGTRGGELPAVSVAQAQA